MIVENRDNKTIAKHIDKAYLAVRAPLEKVSRKCLEIYFFNNWCREI